VAEDPSAPSGRTIDLRITVLPAEGGEARPDPLVFLAGGPGEGAIDTFLRVAPAFDRIRLLRDVVLIDQRGTGGSHPLRCGTPPSDDPEEGKRFAEQCLARLDADPRQYTTPRAVEDLEHVRSALGYERLDLYGASYGSRVALTYLSAHPARVRAAILDGVVPGDRVLGPELAKTGARALDAIFERCASDPSCGSAFPAVRAELRDLLERLGRHPVEVVVPHPRSGRPTEVRLRRDRVAQVIRLMSYASETSALIPLLIHQSARGDFRALAAHSLLFEAEIARAIADGMAASVVCTEDAPFWGATSSAAVDPELERLRLVCGLWPRGAPVAKGPVESGAPVLLLSGEDDPVTPPSEAARAARTLSRSVSVVARGQGHVVVASPCIGALASAFIEDPGAPLDVACARELGPAPFFVDLSGPEP
jgi:pimeloyl-ACP methyl ester carboxylesterase